MCYGIAHSQSVQCNRLIVSPSHRMDKYLFLVRQYLAASFRYLSKQQWSNSSAIGIYLDILAETPLNPTDVKVPNGMRYHVLDIYVDELDKVDAKREGNIPLDVLLTPVRELEKGTSTKAVRQRAKETLEDDRLVDWNGDGKTAVEENDESNGLRVEEEDEDDEWGGIDG